MLVVVTAGLSDGQHISALPAPEHPAKTIQGKHLVGLNLDGTRVAALVAPSQLQILDISGQTPPLLLALASCEILGDFHSYFSPHGKWIAHACSNRRGNWGPNQIVIWDAQTGEQSSLFWCPSGGHFGAWSLDETRFVTLCEDSIIVWNAPSRKIALRFTLEDNSNPSGFAFAANGRLVVSAGHALRFFDVSGKEQPSKKFNSHLGWLAARTDRKQIAVEKDAYDGFFFSRKAAIILWDQETKKFTSVNTGSDSADLWSINKDGSLLLIDLSGSIRNGPIRWFPESPRLGPVAVFSIKEKRFIKALRGDLRSAVFTNDGRIVAVSNESEINIWNCC